MGLKSEQVKHLRLEGEGGVADMSVVVIKSLGNWRLAKGHTGLLVYRISQPKLLREDEFI